MKKLLSFLTMLCAAGLACGQSVDIGIKGGISIPNLSASGSETNPLNEGYSSRVGPGFSLFADVKFSKLFSIQPAIEYSAQGGKKEGFQAFPFPEELIPLMQQMGQTPPTYLYADFNSTAKINYLMIPVLAKFGWDLGVESPFRIYAGAGPFVGFLLNAKQIREGNSALYLDPDGQAPVPNPEDPGSPFTQSFDGETSIKDQLNKVNFGVEGSIGLSYRLNRSTLFVEGGGNYGFLNIQKGTANGKNNTGAATVMVGYAYSL